VTSADLRRIGLDLALVLGGALLALGLWVLVFTQPLDRMWPDLYPTWVAGRLFAAGRYDAIYHPSLWIFGSEHPAWAALMEENGIPRQDGTSFTYSPIYLLLVAPFATALSIRQASWAMFLVNALSVGIIGLGCARLAGIRSLWIRLAIPVVASFSFPVLGAVWLGQNTLPCLALALLGERGLSAPSRGRQVAGLVCWWLAAAVKPWFVLAFLLLLAMRRWRQALVFLGGWAAIFVGLPFLLIPGPMREGYARVSENLLRVTVVPWNDVAIRAHLLRMSWPEWPALAMDWTPVVVPGWSFAVEAAFLAIVAFVLLAWLRRRPAPELVFAVGLFAMLLPLGICWTHYLAFGLPMLVVAAFRAELPKGVRIAGALGCIYVLLGFPHRLPTLLHGWREVGAYAAQAAAAPLLTAWQVELPMLVFLAVAATVVASLTRS
jgi:hypothetical protein